MNKLQFEWDKNKEHQNINKHGISFSEATTVFIDDYAVLFDDPDHSEIEDRFLLLGLSANSRLLIVSHCYRKEGDSIRIISVRKATAKERQLYIRLNKKR